MARSSAGKLAERLPRRPGGRWGGSHPNFPRTLHEHLLGFLHCFGRVEEAVVFGIRVVVEPVSETVPCCKTSVTMRRITIPILTSVLLILFGPMDRCSTQNPLNYSKRGDQTMPFCVFRDICSQWHNSTTSANAGSSATAWSCTKISILQGTVANDGQPVGLAATSGALLVTIAGLTYLIVA